MRASLGASLPEEEMIARLLDQLLNLWLSCGEADRLEPIQQEADLSPLEAQPPEQLQQDLDQHARRTWEELQQLRTKENRIQRVRRSPRCQTVEVCELALTAAETVSDSSPAESYDLAALALEIAWATDTHHPGSKEVVQLLARAWEQLGTALHSQGKASDAAGARRMAAFHRTMADSL